MLCQETYEDNNELIMQMLTKYRLETVDVPK